MMPASLSLRRKVACAVTAWIAVAETAAQGQVDVPAALIPGSCKSIDFNRASLSSPVSIDLLAEIDESGRAVSATAITPVANVSLLSAVTASTMTCKFQPALSQGKPTRGAARMLHQFPAAPAAAPLRKGPLITNVKDCAPTASDYPAASIQLNETGTTRLAFTVSPTGHLTAFGVTRSSGSLRLDVTALAKLVGCRFQPATSQDGVPTSASFEVEYIWKLE